MTVIDITTITSTAQRRRRLYLPRGQSGVTGVKSIASGICHTRLPRKDTAADKTATITLRPFAAIERVSRSRSSQTSYSLMRAFSSVESESAARSYM